jgi:hypothetical protein
VTIRFVVYFLTFTFGPGAAATLWLTRSLDLPRRLVVALGAGVAASAVLIDILGRLGWLGAFPYLAAASAIVALWSLWRRPRPTPPSPPDIGAWMVRDIAACGVILALAIGTGAVVFAHRLTVDANQTAVYGDYDSSIRLLRRHFCRSVHTVPPTAHYAGRELNYVHRSWSSRWYTGLAMCPCCPCTSRTPGRRFSRWEV